jgi:glycosyltransferase involved in cell wall biosynthesis
VNIYRYPVFFAETTKKGYVGEYLIAVLFLTLLPLWVWIKHGLDTVVLYNPPDILWICGLIPKIFGKRLIFDIRDLTPELFASKFGNKALILQRILSRMEFLSCQIANHVVVTNETSRKIICDRNRLDFDRVTTIRQGPDTEKISPTAPDETLRDRAEIIIGYLGNMSPERGVGNLLQALHHLKYDLGYKNWFCIFIGRQTTTLNLDHLATDLGIKDNIWLTGYLSQENWIRMLSTVDICVDPGASNPGNDVSTTNKMMDYMALGKPVVAFHLPERYGTAGDTALYAYSNDNLELARQIALLIDSPELRTKLGNTGRERVVNCLSWQHQKKLLLALFEQLTSDQNPNNQKMTMRSQ